MNILDNQYVIPVFVGKSEETFAIARKVYKKTGIKPHIFADRVPLFQRLIFNCHIISVENTEWLKEELLAFTNRFEEYYCPVLIICDDISKEISERFSEQIGASYLVLNKEGLFSEAQKGEEN